jgi:hypothetical protein
MPVRVHAAVTRNGVACRRRDEHGLPDGNAGEAAVEWHGQWVMTGTVTPVKWLCSFFSVTGPVVQIP